MGYDMTRRGTEHGDEDSYFRLNIWGMSEVRPLLEDYGIVRDCPFPTFPEPPDIAGGRSEEQYQDEVKAIIEGNDSEGPGIPIYKLCSNDGWWVNPVEVRSGVLWADAHHAGWRERLGLSEQGQLALEFVVWMEGSTEGFEVW